MLGKAVTRGRGWRAAGFALHAVNGAVFGLAFSAVRQRLNVDGERLALALALGEHVALYPLCYFVDRYHPARGEPGIPPLLTNARAFGQATVRHALFGVLLDRCLGRARDAARRAGGRHVAGLDQERHHVRLADGLTVEALDRQSLHAAPAPDVLDQRRERRPEPVGIGIA